MPALRLVAAAFGEELETGFDAIRRELEVPVGFDPPVIEAAEQAARRGPTVPPGAVAEWTDRTDLALVTIDPPTSTDLDQAYGAARVGDGYRVFYAISDVAAFVEPGGVLDDEARRRGVTLYSPDQRASLHPEPLNEDAGSLLPDTTKPAILWQIDLDGEGRRIGATATRAMVRSSAKLSYRAAQEHIDAGTGDTALGLLCEIGRLRQALEAERGAISLQLPAQEITLLPNGDYELHYERSLPVEGWNAQISLLTGMAAGEILVDAGHGLLRTLPPLQGQTVEEVRCTARALEIEWPDSESYPHRVRRLDPNVPREATLLTRAARSFRGAGYEAFVDGATPEQPLHGAINAIYAHVTAPLRRLCDRFTNEIVLAACADREPPAWALEALDELPEIMGRARRRDRALERAIVDFVEAVALQCHIGETFAGVVLSHRRSGANVQLRDPAVVAPIDAKPEIGEVVDLVLTGVDTTARRVEFRVGD